MNKITDLKMFPAMAHSIDANGYLLSVSDIWLNKFEYTEEDVIGKKSIDFLTESSKKYALEIVLPEFFKVGYCTNIEYQFVKKDGSIIETLLSATLEKDQKGNHIKSLAIIVDITERKKAENELFENNIKLEKLNNELFKADEKLIQSVELLQIERKIFEQGNVVIFKWINEPNWPVEYVSQNVGNVFGFTPEEIQSPQFIYSDFIFPDDLEIVIGEVIQNNRPEVNSFSHKPYRVIAKNGNICWVQDYTVILRNKSGDITNYLGYVVDITERIKAENELKEKNITLENLNVELNKAKSKAEESEMNLRLLVESSEDMITIHDLNGKYINYFGPEKYSLKPNDFIGKTVGDFLNKENAELLTNQIIDTAKTGHSAIIDIYDYWQGEKAWLEEKIFPLKNENKITYIAKICSIITERKKSEIELVKSQDQYRSLVENLNGIVWEANSNNFEFTFISKQAENILGYSINEWTENPNFWEDHLHSDDKEWAVKFFRENAIKNKKFEFSYRMIASDGKTVWIKERVNNIIELDGVRKLSGMLVDITENKLKNIKLTQNQLLLEESQLIAKLGGWELDLISGELYWTAETYRIHETSPEEFNPTVDAGVSYFLPESKKTIIEALDLAMTIGKGYDLQLETYTTKGRKIDVRTTCRVIMTDGKPIKLTGIFQDITKQVEAESKLRDSEEKYKTLFENNPMPLVVYNRQTLLIQDINQASVEKYGYSKEDINGKTILDIRPKENIDKVTNLIVKKTDGIENAGVWKHQKKNGEVIDVEVYRKSIEYNGEDSILGLLNDVTDKLKIEANLIERERTLNGIIMFSPIPIVLSKISNGELILVNSSFEKLIGADKNYLIGRKSIEFYAEPNEREEIIDLIKTIGKIESKDIKLKRIDGLIIDCLMSVENIRYDNENVNLITLVDISDLKETENNLINARVEAERVSKLKSSFLANMSHELRTPMNGILGFSNFITKLDDIEDIKEIGALINVSASRLMETLNLILDISTIESGVAKIILEEMDLIEFITDNIQLFKVNADSKNITITFDKYFDQLIINSNRQAIQSIISNLINNAIKFTTIGGISIDLEIIIEEYKAGNTVKWAIIKVSDTGIGIEQEHLEIIFDEFKQVSEGINRSFEGTGLGLSLTKKYIELLGGSIGVVSKINEGTTFTVKIPINQTEWVQPKVIEIIEKVENIVEFKQNKHILVIEDDYPSLRLIELLLKGKCVVDSSSKPMDAIEKAKAKNYDLIITDINLGRGLNGLYVTRELRKLPQYKDTAIVAMTAYAMKGDKEEFLEAGCTDYISKPIDQNLLVSMVQDYLNKE